ncbi:hypothetical protein GALMADRAFT_235345 [Galerina marginata CBS 339.88]|uniref:MARVEL domain-containing protein n=1 Tax=Galerina marginata (strain CBS 339.88) TaxID=685588 RepID=A0A067TSB3_GALM3|nr:hypothetical protein GALMADRAFT_235345 [Galerina marginata CBS 339.88]
MAIDSFIRIGHPITFGALLVFSIIEMCISAWLTAKYNAHHNYPSSSVKARVRYLLFVSIWTILISSVYLVAFLVASSSFVASVASHFIFLFLTWILWLAAAAAITAAVGGTLNCSTQDVFVYCGQLNALEGFAWLIWVLLTFMLIFVLIRGIMSSKRGDGYGGGLVEA